MLITDDQLDAMIKNHQIIADSKAPESVRQKAEEYLSALFQLKKFREAKLFGSTQ